MLSVFSPPLSRSPGTLADPKSHPVSQLPISQLPVSQLRKLPPYPDSNDTNRMSIVLRIRKKFALKRIRVRLYLQCILKQHQKNLIW